MAKGPEALGGPHHTSMAPSTTEDTILPAAVDYLAICNPKLSTSDHDLDKQILYFYQGGQAAASKSKPSTAPENVADAKEKELNEQLRRTGLAQGMIQFARFVPGRTPWCTNLR